MSVGSELACPTKDKKIGQPQPETFHVFAFCATNGSKNFLCVPKRAPCAYSFTASSLPLTACKSLKSGTFLLKTPVVNAVFAWLYADVLLSVAVDQVNNSVFKGCWDASSHSVQFLEGMHALPTKDQYSITLSEPAILLPALQPKQQHPAYPQNYSVSFTASVSLPPDAKLEGWQDKGERGHAVGEDESGQESALLLLLAHTHGMFLPVELAEISRAANVERAVQVRVARSLGNVVLLPWWF
eukprot:1027504-Pelagomonas_calceolata.AAC.1